MVRRAWIAVALFLSLCATLAARERLWTDSTGRTMRAEFVREIDGEVTFLKDGKIVTLPLDKLSDRDRQIVRDLAAGKPLPEDPAPVSPPPMAENSAPSDSSPTDVQPGESAAVKSLTSKPVPIENRTWTDIHGNQVTGKYVRIFGSNVVLLRGGKSVTVKFYELSSEDQNYLRELLTSRGQEGLIPPKVDISSTDNEAAPGDEAAESNVAGTGNRSPQGAGAVPAISAPESTSAPPATGGGGYTGPGGSSFPGAGGSPFGGAGPSFPPPSGPSFPGPGASAMPGGGSSFPPTGPSSYPPSAPGYAPPSQPGYAPPGSGGLPSSSPPGMPGSGSSSLDRFQQQMEESRRQQLDSVQRMQDRMNQQHESLFNRHGSTGECLNCKHNLNDSEMRRSSCPYCGVTWDYEIDEYGNKRQLNNSSFPGPFSGGNTGGGSSPAIDARSARMAGLVLGAFIGLAVVAGMIIGTIYIIMSIASASSSSQQRHYR